MICWRRTYGAGLHRSVIHARQVAGPVLGDDGDIVVSGLLEQERGLEAYYTGAGAQEAGRSIHHYSGSRARRIYPTTVTGIRGLRDAE